MLRCWEAFWWYEVVNVAAKRFAVELVCEITTRTTCVCFRRRTRMRGNKTEKLFMASATSKCAAGSVGSVNDWWRRMLLLFVWTHLGRKSDVPAPEHGESIWHLRSAGASRLVWPLRARFCSPRRSSADIPAVTRQLSCGQVFLIQPTWIGKTILHSE